MDPQVTWQRLLDAYSARNPSEAREAAEDLLCWLSKGGFPPQTQPDAPMDNTWNRVVARAACNLVLQRPDSAST